MVLEGKRVILTPITYEDCEDYVRWRNSDFIKSRFIYKGDISVEQEKTWINTMVETGKVAQFIIWDRVDNKKIGCVYLQHIDKANGKCEFGILIGEPDYIGAGRGTEANRLICEYGFNHLGMRKIYLRVLEENLVARHSYQKAGFSEDSLTDDDYITEKPEGVVFMSKTNK